MRQPVLCLTALIGIACAFAHSSVARAGQEEPMRARSGSIHRGTAGASQYGDIPLSFEKNEGQASGAVRFSSRGRGYSLYLTRSGAVLVLTRTTVTRPRGVDRQTMSHVPDRAQRTLGFSSACY